MRKRGLGGNKTAFIAAACLLWSLGWLMVPRALSMSYVGCVAPTGCTGYPLAGASCLIVFPDDGSVADSNGGMEAEAEWCAYVDSQGPTWGWPCGGAFACQNPC
jgi:hypothetical protein